MIVAALSSLTSVLAGIDSRQEALPTPCEEFDVRALRRHLLGWLGYFEAAFSDPGGDRRPDPAAFDGPEDVEAIIGKLAAALRPALDGDAAAATVNVPRLGGAYPSPTVVDLLLVEVLGHGWDLARATGRRWDPPAATCEHAIGALQPIVKPEFRGPGLPFGPEVAVDADAPAIDRLVGFLGRDPAWDRTRTSTESGS